MAKVQFNVRKYSNGKLIIKPAKESIIKFLRKIRVDVKRNIGLTTEQLISLLNPKLRGLAYYYCHVASKEIFSKMNHQIFLALYAWINKRHPKKSKKWCVRKYFRRKEFRNWVFTTKTTKKDGQSGYLDLFNMGYLEIRRHRKIIAKATSFDPEYKEYFKQRNLRQKKCSLYHWSSLSTLNRNQHRSWYSH